MSWMGRHHLEAVPEPVLRSLLEQCALDTPNDHQQPVRLQCPVTLFLVSALVRPVNIKSQSQPLPSISQVDFYEGCQPKCDSRIQASLVKGFEPWVNNREGAESQITASGAGFCSDLQTHVLQASRVETSDCKDVETTSRDARLGLYQTASRHSSRLSP